MQAEVSRGYLDYQDERGCYSVPIGRRSRKCLVILDKKEGEFVRSLEIDLFTGNVYYSVNNETGGGLSYYYDMSSKKICPARRSGIISFTATCAWPGITA